MDRFALAILALILGWYLGKRSRPRRPRAEELARAIVPAEILPPEEERSEGARIVVSIDCIG